MLRKLLRMVTNQRFDLPDLDAIHDLVDEGFSNTAQKWFGALRYKAGSSNGGIVAGMSLVITDSDPSPLVSAQINTGTFMGSGGETVIHELTDAIPCDISAYSNVAGATIWGRRATTLIQTTSASRIIIQSGAETPTNTATRREYRMEFAVTGNVSSAPAGTGWRPLMTLDVWTDQGGWYKPTTITKLYVFGPGYTGGTGVGTVDDMWESLKAALAGITGASWNTVPTRAIDVLDAAVTTNAASISTNAGNISTNAAAASDNATNSLQRWQAHARDEDPLSLNAGDYASIPYVGYSAHAKLVLEFKHDTTLVQNLNGFVSGVTNPGTGIYIVAVNSTKVRIGTRVAIAIIDWKGDNNTPPTAGWTTPPNVHARVTADDGTYITEITINVGNSGGNVNMDAQNTMKLIYF
jgi:hypothetical protein